MAPVETAKLDEISNMLGEHVSDFRVFRTKILGDDEEENPRGRLPHLESTVSNHATRIGKLENMKFWAAGALGVLGMLVGLAEAIAHVASAVKH